MLRKLFAFSFIVTAVFMPEISVGQANFGAEMQMMKSAEKHGAFIENFSILARDKKENEVIAALDPASIKGISEEQLREMMNKNIFPFFAQYDKLKKYEQITKAQAPDGRVGLWHYTYITDPQGNAHPFQIAIIDTDTGLKVLSVQVGQCVKGRHPAIPPCQ
ncbi:MAG: hypothetical protein WCK63_14245 [Betaproteobacteria bacterium]